jgi:DNA-binding transcriptional regulator YhcF (GntR family)
VSGEDWTVEVDPASGVAPYEQLRARVVADVEAGVLRAGDRLPTVRGLAGELGVAPGTVARAYRELEQAGVVETRGRGGTFVMGDEVAGRAKAAAAAYLAETRALGLADAEALALVQRTAGP